MVISVSSILIAGLLLVVGGSRGCNPYMINDTTLIDLKAIGGSASCAIPGSQVSNPFPSAIVILLESNFSPLSNAY